MQIKPKGWPNPSCPGNSGGPDAAEWEGDGRCLAEEVVFVVALVIVAGGKDKAQVSTTRDCSSNACGYQEAEE